MKRNIIKIAGVYTAVILGAGFASGAELLQFFVRFGNKGILGLVLSGLIFSVIGWFVLDIANEKKLYNYSDLSAFLAGKTLGAVFEVAVAVFLFVLFATMLAAGGAVARQVMGFNYSSGVMVLGTLCFISFLFDLDGMVKINSFIAPFMVAGGILIGLYSVFTQVSPAFSTGEGSFMTNWAGSAIIYSSYNIVTSISVLAAMAPLAAGKNTAKYAGLFAGICMTALGVCLSAPLFIYHGFVAGVEIPILKITESYSKLIQVIYLFVLAAAIYTTAIANGFALLQWIAERLSISGIFIKIIIITLGMTAAHAGFSNFVGKVYPIFGYLGMAEIVLIIAGWFRCRMKKVDL